MTFFPQPAFRRLSGAAADGATLIVAAVTDSEQKPQRYCELIALEAALPKQKKKKPHPSIHRAKKQDFGDATQPRKRDRDGAIAGDS